MDAKKRKPNFAAKELSIITEFVRQDINILSSKLNSTVTNQRKDEIWQKITKAVNSVGIHPRSTKDIKEKWAQMKSTAKSRQAQAKRSEKQTGGGPPVPRNEIDDVITNIYKADPSWEGLKGGIESSRPSTAAAAAAHADDMDEIESLIMTLPDTNKQPQATFKRPLEATGTADLPFTMSCDQSFAPVMTMEEEEVQRLCTESSGTLTDLGMFDEFSGDEVCESPRSMARRIESSGCHRSKSVH